MAQQVIRPPVSRNITDASKILRAKWPILQKKFCALTGNDLILTCTHRTIEEQQRLYSQGRTTKGKIVTWVDGIKTKSNHNFYPSRAIDVAVVCGGKISWVPEDYRPIGFVCRDLDLVWGGTWKDSRVDMPHIELPKYV